MKPIHSQGFSCECLHYDSRSTSHITLTRQPLPPHNSLLSPEEDEFFHHASKVYEHLQIPELANALRHLRAVVPFMAQEAYHLFDAGYLTPTSQYDSRGQRYPVLWDPPSLL